MKESIHITNFAGIDKLEVDLSSVVVFIGPQASGKSITVKLLFFFKSFFGEIFRSIDNQETKRDLDRRQIERFTTYFPKESWPKNPFAIHYSINNSVISFSKASNSQVKFNYSDDIKELISKGRVLHKNEQAKVLNDPKIPPYRISRYFRDKFNECLQTDISTQAAFTQLFIPAGRSFFANLQSSIFSFLSENKTLDPFLIEFGSFYENYKRFMDFDDPPTQKKIGDFDKIVGEILNSRYSREKDKDYLIHTDNRKVNLSYASSGQQEILPLLIILRTLLSVVSFQGGGATLYIEEPEAHLFPSAQKKIVQLLSRIINSKGNQFQILVTTHSPYILASFNNLIQAGRVKNHLKNESKKQLFKIVPEEEIINPNSFLAYSMNNGKKALLIDEETQLISSNILDSVSNEISIEFGKMLDLEFGVQ